MKKLKSISIMDYAKIGLVVGLVIGLLMGVCGFVGLSVMEGRMDKVIGTVMEFTKDEPKYEPSVNNMMATMISGIARSVAEAKQFEKKDNAGFKKMFPEENIKRGKLKNTLIEVENFVKPIISGIFSTIRLLILFGAPIGMAIMGFISALIVGFIYNKMGGVHVEMD